MRMRAIWLAGWLSLIPVAALAATAQITTQDGNVIRGEIVSLANGVYTVQTPYGTITIPAAQVRNIDTGGGSNQGGNGNGGASNQGGGGPPPPPPPSTNILRLAGSNTIGDELAPALLEAYSATKGAGDVTWTQEQAGESEQLMEGKGPNNASFTAHLSRHGSGTAFTALLAGQADIGEASRRINKDETAKLIAAGQGDFTQPGQENVLALDGLVVFVSKDNPVDALSITQIRDIYAGRVTDWSQVGGPAGPIHALSRDHNSGTYDTFMALVMTGTPLASTVALVPNAVLSEKVQGDPAAIGYTGFAYLGSNKALNIVTDCGLSFPASELYVRTEEYPLSRRLFLYLPQNVTNGDARSFVDFALSDKGQELAKKKNFIDLVPQTAPQIFGRNAIAINFASMSQSRGVVALDYEYFGNYARRIVYGNRISTTFRFQTDSSELDSRAVRDIDRLADFLKTVPGRNVLIAGFTDSEGSPYGNINLSRDRANHVADLLRSKGVAPTDVQGYGRVAPVACNSTPEGREKNRRVEVWLY